MTKLQEIVVYNFVYSEHNKALVSDGCFFSVGPDNVVLICETFMYLSKFDIFHEYTFEPTNRKSVAPKHDKHNQKFHRLYVSLFNMSRLPNLEYETLLFNRDNIQQLYANCKLYAYGIKTKPFEMPLIKCQFPVFIKTETTSGKNEMPIQKINNTFELFERMHSVQSWSLEYQNFIASDETEEFKFFIAPWQDITEEYRCFVYQRKIISICPQRFWEFNNDFDVSLDDMNKLQSQFVDVYEHDNYCIDVYRPYKGAGLKIIETNEWYNSGPGLFSYEELTNILPGCIMYKHI